MKKRKFFSFMLMGILTLGATSMVTSCKDYDDDINNLQDEQAQLTSQINTLQSTLQSVQSAAASHVTQADLTNALANYATTAKVNEAITSAENAADAAKKAQDAVDALQKQIGSVDLTTIVTTSVLSDSLQTLKDQISSSNAEELKRIQDTVSKYDSAINTLYTAVTQVNIIGLINTPISTQDYTSTGEFQRVQNADGHSGQWAELRFTTALISSNAVNFGAPIAANAGTDLYGAYEGAPRHDYTKDGFVKKSESLIVRVNPANATIDTSMVKLINSKGEEIAGVQIDSVSRYNDLITRAGQTGLWRVYVSPKKYIAEGQPEGATTTVNGVAKAVSYFVAINNTAKASTKDNDANNRYVLSPEDVVFGPGVKYAGTDAEKLGNITVQAASETKAHNISELRGRGQGAFVEASKEASADNTVYAQNGEKITVSFENVPTVDKFYVVRDNNNAAQGNSQTSDINAWNGYTYTGCVGGVKSQEVAQIINVNNGTGKGEFTITIPSTQETGDEVAFRIYAVDADGKILKRSGFENAYGFPFIVYVGKNSSAAQVTGQVTADDAESARTITLPVTGKLVNGTAMLPVNTPLDFKDSEGGTVTFYPRWYDKDNKEVTTADKIADITKVTLFRNSSTPYSNWKDGTHLTYTVTTRGTGDDKTVENTVNFDLTKVLPDQAYTVSHYGLAWRAGQPKNPYIAFMIPANDSGEKQEWTATTGITKGYTDLAQAIRGLNGSEVAGSVAKSAYNDKAKDYTDALDAKYTAKSNSDSAKLVLTPDKKLFEDGTSTQYAATLTHTYKNVSSEAKGTPSDGASIKDKDLTVTVNQFNIEYACPLDPAYTQVSHEAVSWTTGSGASAKSYAPYLVYSDGTLKDIDSSDNLLSHVKVTFTNDAARSALGLAAEENVSLAQILAKYPTNSITVKVLSSLDDQNSEDYFKASYAAPASDAKVGTLSFTKIPDAQSPGTITSYVQFDCKDAFGHTNRYYFPITIKGAADAKRR